MIRQLDSGEPVTDVLGRILAEDRGVPDRPWVMLNMVTSIDGATTVEGGSTRLSDDDDRQIFRVLRSIVDVILVGAGTVRAENYRPVRPDPDRVEDRLARSQRDAPRLVIVSGTLALDPGARVFSDPDHRPAIITSDDADSDRVSSLSEVAEVVTVPDLSGGSIVGALGGESLVLCEGGPTLNGSLVGGGLIDEVNWTIAPLLVSGDSKRMVDDEAVVPPTDMRLDRAWRGDRSLFLRYVRQTSDS